LGCYPALSFVNEKGEVVKNLSIVFVPFLLTLFASACASTQPIAEPISVLKAFEEALNDENLDAAMGFVADDARFIVNTIYTGKAEIRELYQEVLDLGYHSELSDLRADGDRIFWTGRVTIGGRVGEGRYEAVVREGMIVSFITP
jgi:ketosteroid isomerase-like protein